MCSILCFAVCVHGNRSEASNSLNFITNLYSMDKFNIASMSFMTSTIDELFHTHAL